MLERFTVVYQHQAHSQSTQREQKHSPEVECCNKEGFDGNQLTHYWQSRSRVRLSNLACNECSSLCTYSNTVTTLSSTTLSLSLQPPSHQLPSLFNRPLSSTTLYSTAFSLQPPSFFNQSSVINQTFPWICAYFWFNFRLWQGQLSPTNGLVTSHIKQTVFLYFFVYLLNLDVFLFLRVFATFWA